MKNIIFQGKWEVIKGHLQKQWGKLTDDEFKEIEGSHHILYGKLQQHYGLTKDQAEREINDFKKANGL